jgi:hypothetical protein
MVAKKVSLLITGFFVYFQFNSRCSYWSFDKEDSNFASQEIVFADLGITLLDNAFEGLIKESNFMFLRLQLQYICLRTNWCWEKL